MRKTLSIAKALSDENRLRALMAVRGQELCLCQLIELLGLAPSTVSKHLAVLLDAGLVTRRKQGRWVYFQLNANDSEPATVQAIAWITENLQDDPAIREDERAVERLRECDLEELSSCYRD